MTEHQEPIFLREPRHEKTILCQADCNCVSNSFQCGFEWILIAVQFHCNNLSMHSTHALWGLRIRCSNFKSNVRTLHPNFELQIRCQLRIRTSSAPVSKFQSLTSAYRALWFTFLCTLVQNSGWTGPFFIFFVNSCLSSRILCSPDPLLTRLLHKI